jgi:hypothetical protein
VGLKVLLELMANQVQTLYGIIVGNMELEIVTQLVMLLHMMVELGIEKMLMEVTLETLLVLDYIGIF